MYQLPARMGTGKMYRSPRCWLSDEKMMFMRFTILLILKYNIDSIVIIIVFFLHVIM